MSGQRRTLPHFFRYTPKCSTHHPLYHINSRIDDSQFFITSGGSYRRSNSKELLQDKGIGLEICRQLASNGVVVILTARNDKRGIEAVENLKSAGLSNVLFHQLDVKDPASIASLANYIETHFRKLDILVNNAGDSGSIVHSEAAFGAFLYAGGEVKDENSDLLRGIIEETHEKAEECLKTNYHGTKAVTGALLPLLQLSSSPRVVNVTSSLGNLKYISNDKVRAELDNIESLTEERLDDLVQQFQRDFMEDMLKANGWPLGLSAYKVSKVAVNAYTRILARKFPKICINCVHPGFVKTDITCNMGISTAEEGAKAPVMVALLPNDSPSGLFFDRMEVSTF